MELKLILSNLNICQDVINLILQYNATLLGFVPNNDGSISVQDYQTKKELRLLKDNDSSSSCLLLIPEFNLVMRLFASYRVKVWDFTTGDVIYSKGLDNNGLHPVKELFYPNLNIMFWVPKLKKAMVLFNNRIDIFSVSKETGKIIIARQTVGPVIRQPNVNLSHEGPRQINPFEFRITYDSWPSDYHYQKIVTIFNLQTMSFRDDHSKEEAFMVEEIHRLSRTCSLQLFIRFYDGFRSFFVVDENGFQSPVIIHDLNGFQGTLEKCFHVHDSEYRLLYFTYIPGENDRETDFKAILEFKEGHYSFRIISGALQRDRAKAVLLSEHHYSHPNSYSDERSLAVMYPISFVLLLLCLWYFFC